MTNEAPREAGELPQAAVAALRKGHTIEAIKIVRKERGLDLRDAKAAVDQYVRADPLLERSLRATQAEARRGGVVWVLLLLALAVAGYAFLAGR